MERAAVEAAAVAASLNNVGETIVRMSWNGATDVAAWRVLAGASAGGLSVKATVPDSGFESSAELVGGDGYGALGKLDYVAVSAQRKRPGSCHITHRADRKLRERRPGARMISSQWSLSGAYGYRSRNCDWNGGVVTAPSPRPGRRSQTQPVPTPEPVHVSQCRDASNVTLRVGYRRPSIRRALPR